ncbi:MAG: HlyC/CorC family transporter, partial [Alphaproteobacteria bacterium]|nr:HlyC/CorC family transporter [Alphaproteobacteria bacterium]
FGSDAAALLKSTGLPDRIAAPAGYGLVIVIITYLSVIVGELVPKTLALRNPEAIACSVAPFMTSFSKIALPAVWLLDVSTRLLFRLFGQTHEPTSRITDEEIKSVIAEAESAGVLETSEREMISGVMRLADRAVSGLMTPRADVDWIDITAPEEEICQKLIETPHSRLPVCRESPDGMIGVLQTRQLLAAILAGKPMNLSEHISRAPIVPDTADALEVLKQLREASVPMALIHDEYGHFVGVVTPADILEAIAGVFKSDQDEGDIYIVERDDGSWLFSGSVPVDEMADTLGLTLPEQYDYETIAGYFLTHLRRFPRTGEHFEHAGWRFEVVDIDGRRIDKVLVSRALSTHRRNVATNPAASAARSEGGDSKTR